MMANDRDAVDAINEKKFANSSRASSNTKLATWDTITEALGFVQGEMSKELLQLTMAVLCEAGYRSAEAYMASAIKRFKLQGGHLSQDLTGEAKDMKRAAERGIGAVKHSQNLFPLLYFIFVLLHVELKLSKKKMRLKGDTHSDPRFE